MSLTNIEHKAWCKDIARIVDLEAEVKQLKGEEPIPDSWWKDCPKLAQKVTERVITENKRLTERIAELEKRPDYTKGEHNVSEFYSKDNG